MTFFSFVISFRHNSRTTKYGLVLFPSQTIRWCHRLSQFDQSSLKTRWKVNEKWIFSQFYVLNILDEKFDRLCPSDPQPHSSSRQTGSTSFFVDLWRFSSGFFEFDFLQTYFYNDDTFNFNYAQAKAHEGKWKEAEEVKETRCSLFRFIWILIVVVFFFCRGVSFDSKWKIKKRLRLSKLVSPLLYLQRQTSFSLGTLLKIRTFERIIFTSSTYRQRLLQSKWKNLLKCFSFRFRSFSVAIFSMLHVVLIFSNVSIRILSIGKANRAPVPELFNKSSPDTSLGKKFESNRCKNKKCCFVFFILTFSAILYAIFFHYFATQIILKVKRNRYEKKSPFR